jgi:hypothetical protein
LNFSWISCFFNRFFFDFFLKKLKILIVSQSKISMSKKIFIPFTNNKSNFIHFQLSLWISSTIFLKIAIFFNQSKFPQIIHHFLIRVLLIIFHEQVELIGRECFWGYSKLQSIKHLPELHFYQVIFQENIYKNDFDFKYEIIQQKLVWNWGFMKEI